MSDIDDFLGEEETPCIAVSDKYKIKTYDVRNVMVQEKCVNESGEEKWRTITYHPNLELAFKSIVDREINLTVGNGIEEVIKKIEELKNFKKIIVHGISGKS